MLYHCALKTRRNFPMTIFHSFCCSKSLVAIISSIWPHCLVKTPNAETSNTGAPKGQHTEGSKHRKVMIPVNQVWDRILYHTAVVSCHTDISYHCWCHVILLIYHIVLIHHTILIYLVLISFTLITIIHHYIPSCCYHVMLIYLWYHNHII